jgi:hypothetical protein
MLALDAIDDAMTDVFGIDHACDQFVVDPRQQQIGARHRDPVLFAQSVEKLIDCVGSIRAKALTFLLRTVATFPSNTSSTSK